ncbi:MAG TPA: DinB family protein [Marmoricola sp.]|nr:DinB family protein [Marmoricola sp.]
MSAEGSWQPDTKDWTWSITRPCADCGFDPALVQRVHLPELVHENTRGWYGVLDRPDATARPAPNVWSPLEYACHVRDVHRLFDERLQLMLAQDDPAFANWDQDATAIEERYAEQDPHTVGVELVEAAADVAATYACVPADQWEGTGRRSNGSAFTVETLGIYHLHDVTHHLWDVRPAAAEGPRVRHP